MDDGERVKRTTRAACAILAMLLVVLVGCSATDSEAGFGLPTLDTSELPALSPTLEVLGGTLTVESNGCFTFEDPHRAEDRRTWIIWPDTARQDGNVVILGSGARLEHGDALTGSGTYVQLSDLPGGSDESSYFGSFGHFCDADTSGVVLFTDIHS